MINTYNHKEETWIDIDHGTGDEIHKIMDKYNIHPLVGKELTSITPRARVEFHDKYIYCIMHFPAWKHSHSENSNQEIDFIIAENTLITARYDTIDALHKYGKELEALDILNKSQDNKDSGHFIFINMLRGLYTSIFEELEYVEDVTENITSKIFKGKEREMVKEISEVTRTLLDFKKVTDLHHEILESLRNRGKDMFGEDFSREMDSIILDYLKINTTIRSNLEMLHELRDTNDSLLTTKQNETVKDLTVVGSIILPLNLIAVIFAMRTEGMPIINNPYAFWIVVGIMATVGLVTLVYVRHKKLF